MSSEASRAGFVTPPSLPHKADDLTTLGEQIAVDFAKAMEKRDIAGMLAARENLKILTRDIARLTVEVDAELLTHDIEVIKSRIGVLSDPDCPDIGQQFLRKMEECACTIEIDPSLKDDDVSPTARYISYAFGKTVRGFVNEIGINTYKLQDILALMDSVVHESFHSFQKNAAEALHLSPFNPDTVYIMHPEDWIHLENLCERGAYAKEGMFNALLSQHDPKARERSEFDVVSVKNFEEARDEYMDLQRALIHVALNALYKPTVVGDYSRLFLHHYQEVAIKNFAAGMSQRMLAGQSGFVFVRAESEDFYAIGNDGVGPNPFGHREIDPGFEERRKLSDKAQAKLDAVCERYNIPPLEQCITISEYKRIMARPDLKIVQNDGGYTTPMATGTVQPNVYHAPSIT